MCRLSERERRHVFYIMLPYPLQSAEIGIILHEIVADVVVHTFFQRMELHGAALAFKPREFCADLGEMWRAEIGLPMVYSVFVVRRSVYSEAAPLLEKNIKNALAAFRKNPGSVIGKAVGAMRASCAGLDAPALKKYYRNLKYELPSGLFKKAFDYAADLARSEIPTK